MANLIQVNSAFGQCMESIDRVRMVRAIYPELLQACNEKGGGEGVPCSLLAAAPGPSHAASSAANAARTTQAGAAHWVQPPYTRTYCSYM